MYHGSLATEGPWEALVTFQQLLVLADRFGMVDMTPEAISRITTVPLEIITKGIVALERPDPKSRTPDMEGRRIIRLREDRDWGWSIVNHSHYRSLRSAEERRDYMRRYMREKRAEPVKNGHADAARRVLAFLNEKTGKKFRDVAANIEPIVARLKEFDEVTLRAIVQHKCQEWNADEKMAQYLRPETLFGRSKCAQYAGEIE